MRNVGGRPRIDRDKVLRYLCEALRLDCTVEEACSYTGISKSTFYNYCKYDERFLDEIKRAQIYPFLVAKGSIVGAMELGDAKVAMWFLTRYEPRYSKNW